MKLLTTYFFVYLLMVGFVSGQNEGAANDDYVVESPDYVLSFDSLKTKDKLHYGFEIGAGFGTGSYGNYFSTYYRPTVSYAVTPKFKLKTGITYVNSSVHNFALINDFSYQPFSGNISQYDAFVSAQYQLTDKLAVGGSLFYDFTAYNAFDGTSLGKSSGLDNLGYSAYFQYKITDGFFIEGEIRMNDKNPYNRYSSPFSTGMLGGGFENSFFGR